MGVKSLLVQLDKLESFKEVDHHINEQVSKVNVKWHLEHSLLVFSRVLEGLTKSNPENYSPKFSIAKKYILLVGKIGRNKGKAPRATVPEFSEEVDLIEKISLIKQQLHHIKNLHPDSYIEHPYFGHLNVKESIRFLYIHTHHHLKIIRDILK